MQQLCRNFSWSCSLKRGIIRLGDWLNKKLNLPFLLAVSLVLTICGMGFVILRTILRSASRKQSSWSNSTSGDIFLKFTLFITVSTSVFTLIVVCIVLTSHKLKKGGNNATGDSNLRQYVFTGRESIGMQIIVTPPTPKQTRNDTN